MGQGQSNQNHEINSPIESLKLSKKKSELINISNKLFIDLIEMNSMNKFLEKNGYNISDIELGKGSSGIVFSGETILKKEPIAIKLVKCQKRGQAEDIIKEFNILKSIKSHHVVNAIDLLQYESSNVNILITIMNKCECNLNSYLRQIRNNLDKNELKIKIYEICLHLIKGLNDIHKENILHLDIKPSNIMLGRDLKWKYIDMGISQILYENHFIHQCGMTQLYSSPEQYRAYMNGKQSVNNNPNQITKQSDIFSLGLVFAEITGVILDSKQILQDKQNIDGILDIQLNPQFIQFNTNVISKMIQNIPERRSTLEYLERQIQTLLFEAQFNLSVEKNNALSNKNNNNEFSKQQSQTFSDFSQSIKNTNNNNNESTLKRVSCLPYNQNTYQNQSSLSPSNVISPSSTATTNYGTNHLLKSQNQSSALQRNSFKCEYIFNQNLSSTPSSNSLQYRKSEIYPQNNSIYNQNYPYNNNNYSNNGNGSNNNISYNHMNNSINNNNNPNSNSNMNYRFSTIIAQQQ